MIATVEQIRNLDVDPYSFFSLRFCVRFCCHVTIQRYNRTHCGFRNFFNNLLRIPQRVC